LHPYHFYRNREVVNYEDTGVPVEQHLLVGHVTVPLTFLGLASVFGGRG